MVQTVWTNDLEESREVEPGDSLRPQEYSLRYVQQKCMCLCAKRYAGVSGAAVFEIA